jgi:hypothetical protein
MILGNEQQECMCYFFLAILNPLNRIPPRHCVSWAHHRVDVFYGTGGVGSAVMLVEALADH